MTLRPASGYQDSRADREANLCIQISAISSTRITRGKPCLTHEQPGHTLAHVIFAPVSATNSQQHMEISRHGSVGGVLSPWAPGGFVLVEKLPVPFPFEGGLNVRNT